MGFVRFLMGAAGLCLALVIFPACSGDPGSSRGGGGGGGGGTGGAGGASDCGAVGVIPLECGDRVRDPIEACDDGNNVSCDGCSADCNMIEPGFRCPTVGALCVAIVCGDSRIDPPETCDDGPEAVGDGDGCSATCQREDGWECTLPGVACIAAECGDGIVAGFEQCDDGGTAAPGCADDCQLEDGFKCDTPGEDCVPTVCGDGAREGTEQCDDHNLTPFDGCGVDCKNEPNRIEGVWQAACGDAVILPGTNEPCDDGNTNDGDGCSSTCQVEDGFECVLTPVDLPDPLTIPVIYRDFRSADDAEASPVSLDFNNPNDGANSIGFGIAAEYLDAEGRPELSGANLYDAVTNSGPPHDQASFAKWYRTSSTLDPTGNIEVVGELVLDETGNNVYEFSSDDDEPPGFFPLDDPAMGSVGWPAESMYGEILHTPTGWTETDLRNFGFTTEVHYFFVYHGDEVLSFSGDDDLWVFVDGFLCLDVGGLHPSKDGVMSFDPDPMTQDPSATQRAVVAACKDRLEVDKVYEVAIFHAERHTGASNFSLTLDGFVTERSTCDYRCGDGVATRFEFCDDGPGQNTGETDYGHCLSDCSALGSHCGDGIVDEEYEDCDDGDNLGGASGCNPDCTEGASCGDGIRQPDLGEQCDAGPDNGAPGSSCSLTCMVVVQ